MGDADDLWSSLVGGKVLIAGHWIRTSIPLRQVLAWPIQRVQEPLRISMVSMQLFSAFPPHPCVSKKVGYLLAFPARTGPIVVPMICLPLTHLKDGTGW